MYTIGIKTGFFFKKIRVIDHRFGELLHYATKDGSSVTVPVSALKKFVVYPDFWVHQRKLEEEHQSKQNEQRDATEVEVLKNQVEELVRAVGHLKEENGKLAAMANVPVMPPVSPNKQAAEAYNSVVMQRAAERMRDGFQPNQ